MDSPKIHTLNRDGRSISCAVWEGPAEKTPVLCVHGLTRNGRDFDYFASHMDDSRSVYCPDVVGRGQSEHLPAGQIYDYNLYHEDALFLLDELNLPQVDWLGTSMGGIMGMQMAATKPKRIRKLIVNDIGGVVTLAAMQRLNDYVGRRMEHLSLAHAENYLRTCYAGFGLEEHWQWTHMLEHSVKSIGDERQRLLYDTNILNSIRDENGRLTLQEDINLWPLWDNIPHPILLLRGEFSDFLSHEMAEEMCQRNPNATLHEFKGCGHAPALMNDHQLDVVRQWLDAE